MDSQSIKAVFVLPHHDVYGIAAPGTTRILDVLNDATTRYLKLDDVRICAPGNPVAMAEFASTVLVKSSLQAVVLLGDNRSGESKVFFASLARKTVDVLMTLPTILVEGRIHPRMANDLQAYLTLEANAFFPVTAAKIRGRTRYGNLQGKQAILVNRDMVSTISSYPGA